MIPTDSNFRNLSCQLGGFRLNGCILNGTASSNNVLTIDDSNAINELELTPSGKFLKIKVGGVHYYLPLYS